LFWLSNCPIVLNRRFCTRRAPTCICISHMDAGLFVARDACQHPLLQVMTRWLQDDNSVHHLAHEVGVSRWCNGARRAVVILQNLRKQVVEQIRHILGWDSMRTLSMSMPRLIARTSRSTALKDAQRCGSWHLSDRVTRKNTICIGPENVQPNDRSIKMKALVGAATLLAAASACAAPPHGNNGRHVDEQGMTLYVFSGASDAKSCEGDCARNFPPALASFSDMPGNKFGIVNAAGGERNSGRMMANHSIAA
jgi:hypothetical protein